MCSFDFLLYCVALCWVVLCCIPLHCVAFRYIVLCCIPWHCCISLCCVAFCCVLLHCAVLCCIPLCCFVLHSVLLCCCVSNCWICGWINPKQLSVLEMWKMWYSTNVTSGNQGNSESPVEVGPISFHTPCLMAQSITCTWLYLFTLPCYLLFIDSSHLKFLEWYNNMCTPCNFVNFYCHLKVLF